MSDPNIRIRPIETPFDIRDLRAMVSLVALNQLRYCSYSCLFCYVQAGFLSYPNLGIPNIIDWLKCQNPELFDIIYISGDTDSFAPPRTNQALELLKELLVFRKDVLFTTRAVMNKAAVEELGNIALLYRERSLRLIGCMSVVQKTVPILEPKPIPSPAARIAQLHRFKDLGLITILAARPFLPLVSVADYRWILEESLNGAHVVLGEEWYVDREGVIESKVLGASRLDDYHLTEMPFDNNEMIWKVYEAKKAKAFFKEWCSKRNLPFFMRSRPAVEWIRQNIAID